MKLLFENCHKHQPWASPSKFDCAKTLYTKLLPVLTRRYASRQATKKSLKDLVQDTLLANQLLHVFHLKCGRFEQRRVLR